MSNYARGRRFEWRARDFFRERGYFVVRAAQSKPVDLVCMKAGKAVIVECKVRKSLLGRRGREQLREVARQAGGVPVLAYRDGRKIRLVNLETGDPFDA